MRGLLLIFSIFLSFVASAQQDMALPAMEKTDSLTQDSAYRTIRNIYIIGNKKTKVYMVEREFAFQKGRTYMIKHLRDTLVLTREQLINTALFVDAELKMTAVDTTMVDITVSIKERWYIFPLPFFRNIDRNWNEWIHTYGASLARVNYGVKISHNNLSGRNDKLDIFLTGGYTQEVSFNYSQPYMDKKLKHGISFGFNFNRKREVKYRTNYDTLQFVKLPGFARTNISGFVGYSYRKGSKERHNVSIGYNVEKADSAIIDKNPNFFGYERLKVNTLDFAYTFQYFNVDYIRYPLRGWYVTLNASQRFGDRLSASTISGKYLQSWKLFKGSYFMLQAAGSLRVPFKQPYYNSRLLGYGDVSMRGMEYLVVDGVAGGVLKGTFRKKVFGFTFKNPIKSKNHDRIPFTIYAKAFGDVGYVYSQDRSNNSRLTNKLLRTGGFGLDVVTIYDVVLKLEFVYNQLGSRGIYYHSGTDF